MVTGKTDDLLARPREFLPEGFPCPYATLAVPDHCDDTNSTRSGNLVVPWFLEQIQIPIKIEPLPAKLSKKGEADQDGCIKCCCLYLRGSEIVRDEGFEAALYACPPTPRATVYFSNVTPPLW